MRFIVALFALVCAQVNAQCLPSSVSLQVLGSGGPELDDGRASSGYLIWHNEKAQLMVDMGPGTSVLYGQTKAKFSDLQGVLLTHLHVDHSADLPAFVKGSYFSDRVTDLAIFGPDKNPRMPSTTHFINSILDHSGAFAYLSDYVQPELESDYHLQVTNVSATHGQKSHFNLSDTISISALGVHHGPIAALAWKVNVASCVITFSGDMSNKLGLFGQFAKGSDLLVLHNAVPENIGAIGRNLHMTPSQIGKVASQAKPSLVVLSHRMKRTTGNENMTLAEIRKHYQGVVKFADDLSTFQLTSATD